MSRHETSTVLNTEETARIAAVGPRIRMMLPRLTPLEAQIVGKVLASGDFSTDTPLKAVARFGGVSEAMAIKITKKLGFSAIGAFARRFRTTTSSPPAKCIANFPAATA